MSGAARRLSDVVRHGLFLCAPPPPEASRARPHMHRLRLPRHACVARRTLHLRAGLTSLPVMPRTAEASTEAARATGASAAGDKGASKTDSTDDNKTGRAARPPPPPPFPTVAACPEPTCACAAMPDLPPDLPINKTASLHGLIPAYHEQVVVCTGADDWPSRIEDANSGDNLAADLRELFGRGGVYSDPYHNVAVVNASFPPSAVPSRYAGLQSSSVYLLPSFTYVPYLPRVAFDAVEALAKGFLLPEALHAAHDGLSPVHRDRLTRQPAYQRLLYGVQPVDDVLVLICGHGGRDARCGIVGPVLRDAFATALTRAGVAVATSPRDVPEHGEDGVDRAAAAAAPTAADPSTVTARVGLVSHIGGHKFAGNVIVYLPPTLRARDGLGSHPLAGYGVWYGRVEPCHAEGLVAETVLHGRVVTDHFRGAIDAHRSIVRL